VGECCAISRRNSELILFMAASIDTQKKAPIIRWAFSTWDVPLHQRRFCSVGRRFLRRGK
ncbi:MAG: hypothetical protein ACK4E4_06690, partial [Rhodocyclaceae bacterium]